MAKQIPTSVQHNFCAVNSGKILGVYKTQPTHIMVGYVNEFAQNFLLTDNVPVKISGGEFQELINYFSVLSELVGTNIIKL